jgi:gamma-glutamyltranspeptidase/glutathione hydrolase
MRLLQIIILTLFFFCNLSHANPFLNGIVVTERMNASQVGAEILRQGGNAIDAAVAVGYALAVVDPCCGNIGGGGFMTLHLANGENIFINFREKAPWRATKNMFLNAEKNKTSGSSMQGYLAVATPGTVLGLNTALKKYGTMTRQQVMQPAVELAKHGFILASHDVRPFELWLDDFRHQPNLAKIFLKNGQPYQAGAKLIQDDLANTLSLIAEKGSEVFYKGPIAQAIVKASSEHGGILTLEDFERYTIKQARPLQCEYRGYVILSAPPPSSGGVILCEMLKILENFPLAQYGHSSIQSIRVITEAMRYGFIDRNSQLGDPDFVNNPVERLISPEYTKSLSRKIQQMKSVPQYEVLASPELTDTTHYSVMDELGNAVSVTYTLNGFFGARVMAGNTGFLLNDEMDDFTTLPGQQNKFGLVQYNKNSIEPGKQPLSSMAPTIVMKDGKVLMILGTPGGPRIITTLLLTLINMIDYGMTMQEAADAPRFHFQAQPNLIYTEPNAFSFFTKWYLRWLGYHIQQQSTWSAIEGIYVNPDNSFTGVNDARRPGGGAAGL